MDVLHYRHIRFKSTSMYICASRKNSKEKQDMEEQSILKLEKDNSTMETTLLTTEQLPSCLVSPVDDGFCSSFSWKEKEGNAKDNTILKNQCANQSTTTSVTTNELCDHYTPHGIKRTIKDAKQRKKPKWDDMNEMFPKQERRLTPLPLFLWTNSKSVWDIMMHKADLLTQTRNYRLFEITETIVPRMRAILVEWIMEVCEVYRLRRTTYYLAIDYVDRFLTFNPRVPKNQLQLLGISSLYIAAKFEEIYSPKVNEFAYVCDGACSESDILRCERLLISALSWDLNPMTPTSWLSLFMQIHVDNNNALNHKLLTEYDISEYFLYPRYSAFDFVKASQWIDLFSLDPCFLSFKYNVIAATAVYFLYGKGCALDVSGLQWKEIESCVEYMAVFNTIIHNAEDLKLEAIHTNVPVDRRDRATFNFLKFRIPDVTIGEYHSIQTRSVNLDYLEKATIIRVQKMGFSIKKSMVKNEKVDEPNNQNEKYDEEEGDTHNQADCSYAQEDASSVQEGASSTQEGASSAQEGNNLPQEDDTFQEADRSSQESNNLAQESEPLEECDSSTQKAPPSTVMFEIERNHTPITFDYSESFTDIQQSPRSDDGLEYFDCKSLFTFDEILEGVTSYTIKKLFVPNKLSGENDADTKAVVTV